MQALLRWYDKQKRDLPWRHTRDGYRIFISELMLQQTQVGSVIPKYLAWLKRFPSWKSLAKAKTAELLDAWAGLGYNRRALQAREAAQYIALQGEPETEEGWRELKGVGPYMAAALAEFVNHRRAIVIDTNVRRVAGRALLGLPFPQLSDDGQLRSALEQVTPIRGRHWDLPQALMDLGSTICTSNNPACATCPLRKSCKAAPAFLSGTIVRTKSKKKITERIHENKPHPDRIYRGRILGWVREHGSMKIAELGKNVDSSYNAKRDLKWIEEMCTRLIKDRLLILKRDGTVSLPHS